jgi:fructose-bisphosphate aldolase class II
MLSWGLEVNDYGNARLDNDGGFIKVKDQGMSEEMWSRMVEYAKDKGWKKGDYKRLNLPFENKLLSQPREVRERMAKRVEDFTYNLLTRVFNAGDSALPAIQEILESGLYDPGPKVKRIENPDDWTQSKIKEKAKTIDSNKGPEGDFDD